MVEKKKFSKDERKIYSWGQSLSEIKDNPHFEAVMSMLDDIIKSLESSICNEEPQDSGYGLVMARRSGKVAGLKEYRQLTEQYINFFNKYKDQIGEE
jgi:hypothetical protein